MRSDTRSNPHFDAGAKRTASNTRKTVSENDEESLRLEAVEEGHKVPEVVHDPSKDNDKVDDMKLGVAEILADISNNVAAVASCAAKSEREVSKLRIKIRVFQQHKTPPTFLCEYYELDSGE